MTADLFELEIQAITQRRENFQTEFIKMKNQMLNLVENIFQRIGDELNPIIEETDTEIEARIKQFDELSKCQAKLAPLLDMIEKIRPY